MRVVNNREGHRGRRLMRFPDRIEHYTRRVNDKLDQALPTADVDPARLHEAMRYSVFNGGKRVRPLLVYAAGECVGVDAALLDAPAAAIELIHAFSLVHDDLPAMDDDDLRRGLPTVHKRFGEATAILAADALQPLAFAVLASIDGASPGAQLRLVRILADACGSIGMTGGQSIDLGAEGRSLDAVTLEHMFALKTGALIRASVMSAAALADGLDARAETALDGFARAIGVAFQIRDDLLDVEGETAVIGKPSGSDERHDKATYPGLFGIDAARERSSHLLESGIAHLASFGDRAESLRWLARYIVAREH